MKISFGKNIYREAMQGLEMDVDVVTLHADDIDELDFMLFMLRKNKCDVIIQFGDDIERQT